MTAMGSPDDVDKELDNSGRSSANENRDLNDRHPDDVVIGVESDIEEQSKNNDGNQGDKSMHENDSCNTREDTQSANGFTKNGNPSQLNGGTKPPDKVMSPLPPYPSSPEEEAKMKKADFNNPMIVYGDRIAAEKDKEEKDKETEDEEKKDVPPVKKVGILSLFRYADKVDVLMMVIGTLGAIGAGCTIPVNLIIYGNVALAFIQSALPDIPGNASALGNSTQTIPAEFEDLFSQVSNYALQFCAVGMGMWVGTYLGISMWTMGSERQMLKLRHYFLRSILSQEMGWFDTHDSGELGSRMADDLQKIGDGLGDKVAMFIQWVTVFIAGYAMALVQGWKLALAVMSLSPVLVIIATIIGKVLRFYAEKEYKAYAKAGSVAEEVLSAVKTVMAFHGEEKESERYNANLHDARNLSIRKSIILGFGMGMFWVVIFGGFSIAFWYGMILYHAGEIHPGMILQVFFGVLMGSMSLGHALPSLESFANARAAAFVIYDIIDRESAIDSFSEEGDKPEKTEGNLEFKNVYFNYPSRPEVNVLQGFDVQVNVGCTVALVGPSGCGKSTAVQLVQRFYDPDKGQVLLDGRDIRELNIGWLRRQIGVVSQEPVLFATTIAENICYGKDRVTQQEVEAAAREANAHDFIMDLPQKYETMVGERGAQLSGGQKQRIAIARALVSNPKILLLDEATSALDTESESIVQDALEKAQHGRTTLVIAHRLSTIVKADKIVAIEDGKVMEQGTHAELLQRKGLYHSLYQTSSGSTKENIKNEDPYDTEDDSDEEHPMLSKAELKKTGSFRSQGSRASFRRTISAFSALSDNPDLTEEEEEAANQGAMRRILQLNSPEWVYIVVGCVASLFTGGIHPSFSIVFSELLKVFSLRDKQEQLDQTAMLVGLMVSVGVFMCIFKTILSASFGKSGANLTMRIRQMAFRAMLRQEMAWFDDPKNQVGSLTARLASDAALVEGATGGKIGNVIESASTIVVAIVIAFVFGWKLAFVVLAFFPLMVMAGIVQGHMLMGFARGDRSSHDEAARISLEAIDNIRTVASLTKERRVLDRYNDIYHQVFRKSLRRAQFYGVIYGFTQSVMYFAYAASFSFGASLVQSGEMEFFEVFRVLAAIIFSGMAVGRSNSYAPDYTKAKVAAGKIFTLLDRVPAINVDSESGEKLDKFTGTIQFRGIKFRYPARPDVRVLKGIDLEVHPGETVALVGSSGCGKSTMVQLTERFYDPLQGELKFDGLEAKELNLNWLRSQMGFVSQEPVLFDRSIRDNIAYGDNSRDVLMPDIIEAARAANIHSFVKDLPMGYATPTGDKGGQLSGGQKQRVAIARALVRNPKVLLLDEATSALDSESERIVQEALDQARKGRTCIIIAHRLSTIQNADRIAVIHQGRIVEIGTHHQLMARQGHYYNLNSKNLH